MSGMSCVEEGEAGQLLSAVMVVGLHPHKLETVQGNKGYVGEDISYRPSVIDYCLCEGDTMDAFGPRFAEVCMPGGVDIWATSSPPQKGQEVISTYPVVLTDSYGRQTFVACASFLDDVHPGQAIREHSRLCNPGIKARKAVCLCSRYPVVLTCLRLVRHLVELVLPRNGRAVPLFDAAKELVTKLPSPQPGGNCVIVQFGGGNKARRFEVRRPPIGTPYSHEVPVEALFRALSVANVIAAFEAALLQRRIVLRSDNLCSLSLCALALREIIFPLKWNYPFVPTLPHNQLDFLQSPAPYIFGVPSFALQEQRDLGSLVVIDLDSNRVIDVDSGWSPWLPANEYERLRVGLESALNGAGNSRERRRSSERANLQWEPCWKLAKEEEVRACFMDVVTRMIEGAQASANGIDQPFGWKDADAIMERLQGTSAFQDLVDRSKHLAVFMEKLSTGKENAKHPEKVETRSIATHCEGAFHYTGLLRMSPTLPNEHLGMSSDVRTEERHTAGEGVGERVSTLRRILHQAHGTNPRTQRRRALLPIGSWRWKRGVSSERKEKSSVVRACRALPHKELLAQAKEALGLSAELVADGEDIHVSAGLFEVVQYVIATAMDAALLEADWPSFYSAFSIAKAVYARHPHGTRKYCLCGLQELTIVPWTNPQLWTDVLQCSNECRHAFMRRVAMALPDLGVGAWIAKKVVDELAQRHTHEDAEGDHHSNAALKAGNRLVRWRLDPWEVAFFDSLAAQA